MGQVWNTEMTPDYYHVSDEWAKQIALEAFGEIDFETVRVIKVSNYYGSYVLPLPPKLEWRDSYVSPMYALFKTETITLSKWLDRINKEVTRIGYSPYQNCIVLGKSYKHDNE